MEFEDTPTDVATEKPRKYKAPAFTNKAKQQSKVTCSWDEDDPSEAASSTDSPVIDLC